jgi:hypothetical protein
MGPRAKCGISGIASVSRFAFDQRFSCGYHSNKHATMRGLAACTEER